MKKKIKEWLIRYTPAEILGILTAYLGFYYAMQLNLGILAASYAAAMMENVGFYGALLAQDFYKERKEQRERGKRFGFKAFFILCVGILAECGPAEVLDSFFIRPFAMNYSIELFGTELGVLVGKIIGDIFFYVPVVLIYEYRKKLKARVEI